MKRKLCLLLMILSIIAVNPLSALADDTAKLRIDDSHVYDGMDKSYQEGYAPAVANGKATVVIPLVSNAALSGNTLTATPSLGDTSSSTFVFKNYQKTVAIKDYTFGAVVVSAYVVRFDLELKPGRVNGVYPVITEITADAGGENIMQSFTSYVTVSDGKDPDAPTTTPAPAHQPKLIISGYAINPDPVVAGGEFTATVTLKNAGASKAVYNTFVTVSCDSQNFALQNESSNFYLGKIARGKTVDVEIRYKTDLETPAQRYNITLAMEYANSDAQPLSSQSAIQVEVTQPINVQMDKISVPPSVNAGDTMPLNFQVMNMGRSRVYNVRIGLTAPGLIPTQTAFIGDVEAGAAAQGRMDVFIGTKDMTEGYEGEDKYGYTNGKITLTYEDGKGQSYTLDTDIFTMINEPEIEQASTQAEEAPDKESQWWISLIIGGAVIAIIVILLISRGKRKKHEDI